MISTVSNTGLMLCPHSIILAASHSLFTLCFTFVTTPPLGSKSLFSIRTNASILLETCTCGPYYILADISSLISSTRHLWSENILNWTNRCMLITCFLPCHSTWLLFLWIGLWCLVLWSCSLKSQARMFALDGFSTPTSYTILCITQSTQSLFFSPSFLEGWFFSCLYV